MPDITPKPPFRQDLGSDREYAHCVQCRKERPVEVMTKDLIVKGWTCHPCEMKLQELPEIELYIIRLERSHANLLRLAVHVSKVAEILVNETNNSDAIAYVAGKKHLIEVEEKYSKMIKDIE